MALACYHDINHNKNDMLYATCFVAAAELCCINCISLHKKCIDSLPPTYYAFHKFSMETGLVHKTIYPRLMTTTNAVAAVFRNRTASNDVRFQLIHGICHFGVDLHNVKTNNIFIDDFTPDQLTSFCARGLYVSVEQLLIFAYNGQPDKINAIIKEMSYYDFNHYYKISLITKCMKTIPIDCLALIATYYMA